MKKSYYLFNPGRMSRQDNTLKFQPIDEQSNEGQPRYIPVEGVDNIYCFGSLDANSALYNFLGKHHIAVHFFDYYEHYTGSFMPKDYLLAGKMQVEQTRHYMSDRKRLVVARTFVEGAAFNMAKNLKYYQGRQKDVSAPLERIEKYVPLIAPAAGISELMGIEGNIRQAYYEAFGTIINDFEMGNRSKQPPQNEVNALISFGNMMCYTVSWSWTSCAMCRRWRWSGRRSCGRRWGRNCGKRLKRWAAGSRHEPARWEDVLTKHEEHQGRKRGIFGTSGTHSPLAVVG